MHARRGAGFSPLPISYTEVAHWAQLTRRAPDAVEIDFLMALDQSFLQSLAKSEPDGRQ